MAGWAMVGLGALGLYESSQAASDAQASADWLTAEQLALAREQWDLYKNEILPLEMQAKTLGVSAQSLALSRGRKDFELYEKYYAPAQELMMTQAMEGLEPQYERARTQAAGDVEQAFRAEEGIAERNKLRMGLRPGSGRFEQEDRSGQLAEAATKAHALTGATERERDRVEGVNFNRLMAALGRQPGAYAPTQGAASPNMFTGLNRAMQSGADYYGGMAGLYRQNIGDIVSSGLDLWDRFGPSTPSTSFNYLPSADYTPVEGDAYMPAAAMYAEGGLVEQYPGAQYAKGGMVSGPEGIDRVPATIDGQQPARLTSGEYVVPKEVVDAKGTEFFDKLLERYKTGTVKSSRGLTLQS